MSKGSWTRPKSKDVPDKKVKDEWDRLFGEKTTYNSEAEMYEGITGRKSKHIKAN